MTYASLHAARQGYAASKTNMEKECSQSSERQNVNHSEMGITKDTLAALDTVFIRGIVLNPNSRISSDVWLRYRARHVLPKLSQTLRDSRQFEIEYKGSMVYFDGPISG